MKLIPKIKAIIESQLNQNRNRFIIFPFGDIGLQVKNVLKDCYGIEPEYILDNHLYKYNKEIKPLNYLECIDYEDYVFILASNNKSIYAELKKSILRYVKKENLLEIEDEVEEKKHTIVGRYTYGPLCNHYMVKEIGSFSSIAPECEVVPNHPMEYLSTHTFLYFNEENYCFLGRDYSQYPQEPFYFAGVEPRGMVPKTWKITIGNDVWLGRRVIITNGANIGNGVIAAAGAVITNDVPDYAVVAGVPARIIRYRYTPEQIDALNRIQWWNWSDDEIRERYDDFYISIEEFIKKYDVGENK